MHINFDYLLIKIDFQNAIQGIANAPKAWR